MIPYCRNGRGAGAALTFWVLILLMVPLAAQARTLNGFDLSNALVPADDIHKGGPPRDGIPSIDHPKYQAPEDTRLWRGGDLMLTYDVSGASYAYPAVTLWRLRSLQAIVLPGNPHQPQVPPENLGAGVGA